MYKVCYRGSESQFVTAERTLPYGEAIRKAMSYALNWHDEFYILNRFGDVVDIFSYQMDTGLVLHIERWYNTDGEWEERQQLFEVAESGMLVPLAIWGTNRIEPQLGKHHWQAEGF